MTNVTDYTWCYTLNLINWCYLIDWCYKRLNWLVLQTTWLIGVTDYSIDWCYKLLNWLMSQTAWLIGVTDHLIDWCYKLPDWCYTLYLIDRCYLNDWCSSLLDWLMFQIDRLSSFENKTLRAKHWEQNTESNLSKTMQATWKKTESN